MQGVICRAFQIVLHCEQAVVYREPMIIKSLAHGMKWGHIENYTMIDNKAKEALS